jgi:hypothetical protein
MFFGHCFSPLFFVGFWVEYCSWKESKGRQFGDLLATFSVHRFLDAFWSSSGSLLSLFRSHLALFEFPLAPFWSTFASNWIPFGACESPLAHFGTLWETFPINFSIVFELIFHEISNSFGIDFNDGFLNDFE